jgi:hypothetical protein
MIRRRAAFNPLEPTRLRRISYRGDMELALRVMSFRRSAWVSIAGGTLITLDPIENLFPMDFDIFRRPYSDANLGAL